MCTALKYQDTMGRNFDYEVSYGEEIVKIPREEFSNDFAVIGIAMVYTDANGSYPLLYDGMNEYGLCMAGLAFEGNAYYFSQDEFEQMNNKHKIKAYDVILSVLGKCSNVQQVKKMMSNSVIVDNQISKDIHNSDMHWFVCDEKESIIIEQTKDGMDWYDTETGVLTNNPVYPRQLAQYTANKGLIGQFKASYHTRGNETEGLNGSYTSAGRFQRVSYLKGKLEEFYTPKSDKDKVNQTFHLLASVEQLYGATPVNDKFEYTIYSIVYNMKDLSIEIKKYDNFYIGKTYLSYDLDSFARTKI